MKDFMTKPQFKNEDTAINRGSKSKKEEIHEVKL